MKGANLDNYNPVDLFLLYIVFDISLNSSNAISKYCFSVIMWSFFSSDYKQKSLKSQSNLGKCWANSSSLSSIDTFFIFIIFGNLIHIYLSMAQNALYTNKELINIAIKNIILPWLISSS